MTDKERIERDADEYVKRQGTHDRPDITKHGYIAGATAERQKAWNEAIDECILVAFKDDGSDWIDLRDKLEALKHKQP